MAVGVSTGEGTGVAVGVSTGEVAGVAVSVSAGEVAGVAVAVSTGEVAGVAVGVAAGALAACGGSGWSPLLQASTTVAMVPSRSARITAAFYGVSRPLCPVPAGNLQGLVEHQVGKVPRASTSAVSAWPW